jgi:apolipoprotein D and lipocalin family protein
LDEASPVRFLASLKFAILCGAALGGFAISTAYAQPSGVPATSPLQPIASVELNRYQGLWYQLALYPNRFQKACQSNTRATYTLLGDGSVQVINQCRNTEGRNVQVIGQAKPADSAATHTTVANSSTTLAPPKLKVRFAPEWLAWLPLVWGDYWVIQLAADYRYAVVSEPSREYLWVLARSPALNDADWSAIEARLQEQGFDTSKLVRETHTP